MTDMDLDIVLASASPRRRALLENIGLRDFEVMPATGPECIDPGTAPQEAVCKLSRDKALEVSGRCEKGRIIIAADTVVALDHEILGKPADAADAENMLRKLSGRTHTVFTGVTVLCGDKIITEFESARVCFREMSEREIRAYAASGEPLDKAGAYGAQGLGALFVERIDGDFFCVMGLPLCKLSKMLEKLDVRLL